MKCYCLKCKMVREVIKAGFGNVGGLIGNARYKCSICNSEDIQVLNYWFFGHKSIKEVEQ